MLAAKPDPSACHNGGRMSVFTPWRCPICAECHLGCAHESMQMSSEAGNGLGVASQVAMAWRRQDRH
eukprot:717649-Amphidinium_carterae.1